MSERARYERDGDLGVLTIDDPPLNLFGRELTEAVVAALDAAAADCAAGADRARRGQRSSPAAPT